MYKFIVIIKKNDYKYVIKCILYYNTMKLIKKNKKYQQVTLDIQEEEEENELLIQNDEENNNTTNITNKSLLNTNTDLINIIPPNKECNLTKLTKTQLLKKCQELGINNYKSKNKGELIDLINVKTQPKKKVELIDDDEENELANIVKCDIFTPDEVSNIMSSKLLNYGKLLEPCVGTGNLLKYINFENYNQIDIYELKLQYINKINDHIKLNKFNCDFLKKKINETYDNIILNPPYIKIQDLPIKYRNFITTNYELLNKGSIDIYYAFIIKCLTLLNDNGVMVSITPNSYLYTKSAYELRKYLFENRFIKEIIDFKEQKIFNNASVYCCITIFDKSHKTNLIYNGYNISYENIVMNYSLFNFNSNQNTLKNICKIRNGIATLRNKIFIKKNMLFNEPCWKQITNGPNINYIIYPYENEKIIDEDKFQSENPLTYQYLLENKKELSKRDYGNKIYPSWYAYGRSQSIRYLNKKCIYIPCFLEPTTIPFNLFEHENILHSSCLCLEPNNEDDIELIKNIIISNVDYINDNSSKRSAGWINISSSLLYNLPLEL